MPNRSCNLVSSHWPLCVSSAYRGSVACLNSYLDSTATNAEVVIEDGVHLMVLGVVIFPTHFHGSIDQT